MHPTGALTSHLDVAQVVLYGFWLFFAALIFYLRREDRREGYPTEKDRSGRVERRGAILIPRPKLYPLGDNEVKACPNFARDDRELAAERAAPWSGAPIEPTGDAMVDGIGPAAWALRKDEPELTAEGHLAIVPMRVATDFFVVEQDVDPRGVEVYGADDELAGKVTDVWVDRTDPNVRYLEVELANADKTVLLPMVAARVSSDPARIDVRSILAEQFARVPTLANPDQITVLEEDKICAYYAGGRLYAEPSRLEPLV